MNLFKAVQAGAPGANAGAQAQAAGVQQPAPVYPPSSLHILPRLPRQQAINTAALLAAVV